MDLETLGMFMAIFLSLMVVSVLLSLYVGMLIYDVTQKEAPYEIVFQCLLLVGCLAWLYFILSPAICSSQ